LLLFTITSVFERKNGGKSIKEEAVKKRLTITEAAEMIGISPKTLMRWEKSGKVRKAKRDFRGWRVYEEDDVLKIRDFHDTLVEV
jgi:DNA-binding XRE family transcriptional regulator